MIHLLVLLSSLLSINTTHCWGSSKSNINGDVKHDVNFYGKLVTQQGQEYIVENISIQGEYKQIVMYDKPIKHPEPSLNEDTKQLEIKLDVNPSTDLSSGKVDLSETDSIKIPFPQVIWVYQKKSRQQRIEFIEIHVISKSGIKREYLVERKIQISCDEIDSSGPQEKRVPLSALDTLTIEGYSSRISVSGDGTKFIEKECDPKEKKPKKSGPKEKNSQKK